MATASKYTLTTQYFECILYNNVHYMTTIIFSSTVYIVYNFTDDNTL